MNDQAYRFSAVQAVAADLLHSTCWYCEHAIATGKRFCDKFCAEAFEEDELAAKRRVMAGQLEQKTSYAMQFAAK